MATIYEISDKYKFIQQLIEDGAELIIFEEALNAINDELSNKLENYASLIKNIESDIEGLKVEEKRLGNRRKSHENLIKRMKENMQQAMITAGQSKIKGEKFNFNIQKNPPSLVVLDENLIPKKFVEVHSITKVDMKAISEDLKNGVKIPGVEKRQGESLRIR